MLKIKQVYLSGHGLILFLKREDIPPLPPNCNGPRATDGKSRVACRWPIQWRTNNRWLQKDISSPGKTNSPKSTQIKI